MGFVIGFLALIAVYVAKRYYLGYKESKALKDPDYYAFGLAPAIEVKRAVEHKQYVKAERLITGMNSDNLTQTIDCLTLSMDEQVFLEWLEASNQKQIPTLFVGVHYNHQGWRARSHSYAEDVSPEGAQSFYTYQAKSGARLLQVADDPRFREEACCRLIRHYMGQGNLHLAEQYFHKTIEINKDNFWAYLRFAEAAQPKWGGNLKMIDELLALLPARKLIQHSTKLKLILDGLGAGQNYFGIPEEDIKPRTAASLAMIDKELTAESPKSIHRYVLYGYMAMLGSHLDLELYHEKYEKKMNHYYALYPFGIQA